ncbi:MAG: serine/threonine-protein kinase [Polyangiaceae bacterium]
MTRAGRYEMVSIIASGGMATVYRGRVSGARGFERDVAVKVMHPHLARDPHFVAMFLDEARLAAAIKHPNVVPTIDVAEDAEGLMLVMELIDGAGLHSIRKDLLKTMPIGVALRIELDLLAGLHAAHELCDREGKPLSIIHRDVSPHNVLVGSDGSARIMDFGIARAEQRSARTRTGETKGKIGYMAPEQIRSEPIDKRIDVYAAGMVFWEIVAGEPAIMAETDAALVFKALAGEVAPLSSVRPELPAEFDSIVKKAIAASRDDRYATCAEFAADLEAAAAKAGIAIASRAEVGAISRRVAAALQASNQTELPVSRRELPSSAGSSSAHLLADLAPASRKKTRVSVVAACIAGLAIGGLVFIATRGEKSAPAASAGELGHDARAASTTLAPPASTTSEVATATATSIAGPDAASSAASGSGAATNTAQPRSSGTFRPKPSSTTTTKPKDFRPTKL